MDAGQPCSPDGRRFNRAWSDPRGTAEAPAPRPEPIHTRLSAWIGVSEEDTGLSRETRVVCFQFLPELGKAPASILYS